MAFFAAWSLAAQSTDGTLTWMNANAAVDIMASSDAETNAAAKNPLEVTQRQTYSQTLRSMAVAEMRGKARLRWAWSGRALGRLLAPSTVPVPPARSARRPVLPPRLMVLE